MDIDSDIRPEDLRAQITRVFRLAARKVHSIDRTWDTSKGTPVFTVGGEYTTRGWTEWTQGFVYGCAILAFDGLDDRKLLELGRKRSIERMTPHLTHTGVHDHGFNNLSTYGNLLRLMSEGRIGGNDWEADYYRLAIKVSGAVQAARWADLAELEPGLAGGYIYSFNGPHSLFIDTMRTIRILGAAHKLGHVLMGENDRRICLLGRLITHALTTAQHIIWYGQGRDAYDVRGRVAHEGIFNRNDGSFRCPGTQQGYSPFSTWTRGLAWAMLGFAEELEFLKTVSPGQIKAACGLAKSNVLSRFARAARATCDHYINDCSALDGVPYWDNGAPGLARLAHWRDMVADPFNDFEPVDSSAAAIGAQGLLRLGRYLGVAKGNQYTQAGLTIARTLFEEPYLATSGRHQGLLLHSVYHRPNGWDHIPAGRRIPCGESSMWGDYHLLELAILINRLPDKGKYPTFFDV